jgi:thiol-disulfide isomerase/thioredoxin
MKPTYEKGRHDCSIQRSFSPVCSCPGLPSRNQRTLLLTIHTFRVSTCPQCIVANVDADAEPNRPLAEKYGVKSFPTIKFFPKGGEPVDYTGGRSEADFVAFLNEKCGTHRAVGGGLNDEVGVAGFSSSKC